MIERLLMVDLVSHEGEVEAEQVKVELSDDAVTFRLDDLTEMTFRREDLLEVLGVDVDSLEAEAA